MRTGLLFSMIFLFCAHVLIVLYDIALRQIRSLIDILPLLISGTGAALIWFELTALSPVVLVTGAAGAVFASYVLRLVSIDLRRASENAPA